MNTFLVQISVCGRKLCSQTAAASSELWTKLFTILSAFTRIRIVVHVEILSPANEVVKEVKLRLSNGTQNFEWDDEASYAELYSEMEPRQKQLLSLLARVDNLDEAAKESGLKRSSLYAVRRDIYALINVEGKNRCSHADLRCFYRKLMEEGVPVIQWDSSMREKKKSSKENEKDEKQLCLFEEYAVKD